MKKICPRCGEVWEGYHDESNSNHFCKTGCLSYSEANTPVTPEYYQGQICDGCGNEFFVKALTKINEKIFCEECLYVYKNSFNKEYHKRPHPAKFSKELLPVLASYCYGDILDIMGGTGRAGLLKNFNKNIKSVTINELEREWAEQAYDNNVDTVITGDARNLSGWYDCIVTSPPYGNRMADNFKAGKPDSRRKRYVGDLGRQVSKGSVCCKHFGKGYEEEMTLILDAVISNIVFDRFILNISNFIRNFKEVDVVSWYKQYFMTKSFVLVAEEKVVTRRQKGVGANTHLRVPSESILIFDRIKDDTKNNRSK